MSCRRISDDAAYNDISARAKTILRSLLEEHGDVPGNFSSWQKPQHVSSGSAQGARNMKGMPRKCAAVKEFNMMAGQPDFEPKILEKKRYATASQRPSPASRYFQKTFRKKTISQAPNGSSTSAATLNNFRPSKSLPQPRPRPFGAATSLLLLRTSYREKKIEQLS